MIRGIVSPVALRFPAALAASLAALTLALPLLFPSCSSSPRRGMAAHGPQAQYERAALAAESQKAMAPLASPSPAAPAPPPPAIPDPKQAPVSDMDTEEYRRIIDNPFLSATDNPLSTFSIDVDTASWPNVRRFLAGNDLPYPDAVRIEELVNYFPYGYPAVTGPEPVAARFAMTEAPWNLDHRLLRISLRARDIPVEELPPSNLVFLLDTSGSMQDENKLPLLKEGLRLMVEKLRARDRVSIVAYAGSAGVILEPTAGDRKDLIIAAFDRLEAGGSTAGGEGMALAYDLAARDFIKGGNNRVILCTDGDFNVGVSSSSELERMIEQKRQTNIYLTVLGLGMGNYKDGRMVALADKGNGNYAYIDNLLEARKVLGKEIWGNLFAVAKDVKIQIEFNPAQVREYRLIGYEKRLLAREDFNDDSKDAGEMGAGQTVTAFYELALADSPAPPASGATDALAFQSVTLVASDDMLVFKLRYKVPGDGAEASQLLSERLRIADIQKPIAELDEDFRFAASVVEVGMLLRDSPYKGRADWDAAIDRARDAKGPDHDGYRAEFVRLSELAKILAGRKK
ncbi:MAG: VWA domain-containing protein [Spirochaetota bacterium]